MRLEELVERAAFELVGLHPDDQGAALAAACEWLATYLQENQPWLTDAQIGCACAGLVRQVRARLREIDSQPAGQQVH